MPQRTNKFQQLIHQIESALHADSAIVEESAMVLNHHNGREEEIDIVAIFTVGERVYRTGIQVRDQSRKASAGWVRDCASQADGCKLDRMVLVHSKGFSKIAKEQANHDGVELLEPQRIDAEGLAEALRPFRRMRFIQVQPHHLHISLAHGLPLRTISLDSIIVVDGQEATLASFRDHFADKTSQFLTAHENEHNPVANLTSRVHNVKLFRMTIKTPAGSKLIANGEACEILSLLMDCRVCYTICEFEKTEVYHYGNVNVVNYSSGEGDDRSTLTIQLQGETPSNFSASVKAHFEPDDYLDGVQTMTVTMNPIPEP